MPPPPSEPAPPAKAHRLANAASVYLRSAAEQSIDWHPWGTEPFALARAARGVRS